MTSARLRYQVVMIVGLILLCSASPAMATQTHGQPEGLYVHQIAHLFFIISMGILEFWLRQRNLVREPGWKYIQLAAVLFILWNLNAICVHFMDEQIHLLQIRPAGPWHMEMSVASGGKGLAMLYYILKLDHLLCVPAMLCLYLGLKSLLRNTENEKESSRPS